MDTGALISGQHKILTGSHGSACWMGPHYPNGTQSPACNATVECGDSGVGGLGMDGLLLGGWIGGGVDA